MVMKNGKPMLAHEHGARSRVVPAHRMLCVDPGDVHVGVAVFKATSDRPWLCIAAYEFTPETFLPWYVEGLRQLQWRRIVVESWRLFPEAAPMYVGSDMPTSRLIGGITALRDFAVDEGAWFDERPELSFQSPQIKVPTRGWLKRRKMRSVAKILGVSGDHAQDAELHGYKHLIDAREDIGNATTQEQYWKDQNQRLTPSHDLW